MTKKYIAVSRPDYPKEKHLPNFFSVASVNRWSEVSIWLRNVGVNFLRKSSVIKLEYLLYQNTSHTKFQSHDKNSFSNELVFKMFLVLTNKMNKQILNPIKLIETSRKSGLVIKKNSSNR